MADKLQGGIKAGSVDFSAEVMLRSTGTNLEVTGKVAADVTASYWRQGGVRTAISAMSNLGSVNAAHTDGGWVEVDSANMPGVYRIDFQDAAFAAGADWVMLYVKVANCYSFPQKFALTTDTVQTGDSFARLGAPAGAVSISNDIAAVKSQTGAIESDTQDIQTRLPGALTAGGRIKAEAETITNGAIVGDTLAQSAVDKITNDVFSEALPGSFGVGTAGRIIGDKFGITIANGCVDADVERWKGTVAAAVDSAGYPVVTIKDGAGQGEILTSAGVAQANVKEWDTTPVAPQDASGYPKVTIKNGAGNGEIAILNGSVEARIVGMEVGGDSDVADAVKVALDTAIPGSPTANSINERVKTLDDNYTAARAPNLDNLDTTISSRASPAQVDTEMRDVLTTELLADPAQGAPSSTPSVKEALSLLYFYLRNEVTNDGTTLKVKNDAGTVVWKRPVSEVAGLFTRGKAVTGP